MQTKSLKNIGPMFQDFETLENAGETTSNQLTSSVAGSRARMSAEQANAPASAENVADYGQSSPVFLASCDRVTHSWRTSQISYLEKTGNGLERYLQTWPRSGLMQSGIAYRLPPLVRRISGTAFSYWPTPNTPNGGRSPKEGTSPTGITPDGKKRQIGLGYAVKMVERQMWPTPTAMKKTGGAALCKWGGSGARSKLRQVVTPEELNGALNPEWVEWLMGFPIGWTDLQDSETP
jgi:hypothetical protein